jgi:hypothetical protein
MKELDYPNIKNNNKSKNFFLFCLYYIRLTHFVNMLKNKRDHFQSVLRNFLLILRNNFWCSAIFGMYEEGSNMTRNFILKTKRMALAAIPS